MISEKSGSESGRFVKTVSNKRFIIIPFIFMVLWSFRPFLEQIIPFDPCNIPKSYIIFILKNKKTEVHGRKVVYLGS